MNIQQAITRYRIQRSLGGLLIVSGAAFYFVSLLMAIYRAAESMSDTALWRIGALIQNAIAALYQTTEPYIGFVWRNVPTLNQADLLTHGNLLFLGFLGVIIVGKQLMLSGSILRMRVQREIKHVEELQWRQSMMQTRAPGDVTISADNIAQINIYQQPMPANSEKEWWTRPLGVIGLTIIGGYLVAVLAKLTGMV